MQTKFDELLEFPCSFPYKVVGNARANLADDVVAVVQSIVPGDYTTSEQASSKGTYVSVTIRVTVQDKPQVESLYQRLAAIEGVKRVL
ncbi:DUF493 family protein YbeD [Paraferrimonas sp. SM1919]|uniref:DUF493 family protein YbeD n=1 Tax=Paraferrimonas sp. SM1919 TaxID=2662263 RepID=UPI0013D81EED|nr:DUF493 family protein YbeD [Paraferrimonas sp. SM1919]